MYSSIVCGAAGFALGVYLLRFANDGFTILFLTAFILIYLLNFIITRRANRRLLFAVVLSCVGALGYNNAVTYDNFLADYCNKEIFVTGRICDIPEDSYGRFKYKVITDQFSVSTGRENEFTDFNYRCFISVTSDTPFNYGDTLKFSGTLKEYTENPNSSVYNSKFYYNAEKIFFRMYAESPEYAGYDIYIPKISYIAGYIKNYLYNLLSYDFNLNTNGMLQAVFFDITQDMDDNTKYLLNSAGTGRFLYNGRIHCMIFLAIFSFLACLLNNRLRNIMLVVLMTAYIMLNCGYGAAMRAMLMVILASGLSRLTGIHNFFDTISASVIIIGLVNPMLMYDSGLIMSVCAAVSVKLFLHRVYGFTLSLIPVLKTARFFAVYIIFMVILLPLSARLFNSTSPYSLILTPVFFVLILLCFITAPFYFISTIIFGKSFFFDNILEQFCQCMLNISRFVAELPGALIRLPEPSVLFLCCWFSGIFIMYLFHKKTLRPYLITIFTVFTLFTTVQYIKNLGYMYVHFISVGQGDAAAVTIPGKMTLLSDGGGGTEYSSYDPGRHEFLPYLIDNGLFDIDIAFVSHFHKDHVMGIVAAMEELKVRNLYIPDVHPEDELRDLLISTAEENGTAIHYINKSGTIKLLNDVEIDVIMPFDISEQQEMNEHSVLYRVRYGDFSVLFTGDVGTDTENMLADRGEDMDADILKVPHHGSANSSSEKLIRAVSPDYAIAGIGQDNTYGFPKEDTLKRYKKYKVPFLSTATSGNLVIKASTDGSYEIFKN